MSPIPSFSFSKANGRSKNSGNDVESYNILYSIVQCLNVLVLILIVFGVWIGLLVIKSFPALLKISLNHGIIYSIKWPYYDNKQ